MKPTDALLAIIDDSEFVHLKVPELAEALGAQVVARAQTPEEADAVVEDLGTSGANVVLMDGSLTADGYEGYKLIDRIRAEHPGIHILSISMDPGMGKEFDIPTIASKGTDADSLRAAIEAL